MIFYAYAAFLLAVALALSRIATSGKDASIWQRGYGTRVRAVALAMSLTILLLSFTTAIAVYAETDGVGASLGTLLWTGLIVGSALYCAGAASWTGNAAFWSRAIGWMLMAPPLLFPSTLTLGLPLVGVLAFTVTPISSRAPEELLLERNALRP